MDNLVQTGLIVVALFATVALGVVVYDQYKEDKRKWGENHE